MYNDDFEVIRRLRQILSGKSAIICLGNELIGDDALGLIVCRLLEKCIKHHGDNPHVRIVEAWNDIGRAIGLALQGYNIVIVDAVLCKDVKPYQIVITELSAVVNRVSTLTTHTLDISLLRKVNSKALIIGLTVDPSRVRLGLKPSVEGMKLAKRVSEIICSLVLGWCREDSRVSAGRRGSKKISR